jgi:osmotically-inducible protein OsmY
MKSNEQLQQDVEDALKFEPSLHAAEIGVSVADGIVTLSGLVDNWTKRTEAENAAKSVKGVKAVVEQITVQLPGSSVRTDQDIAALVVKALEQNLSVPAHKIKVTVETGWVYLEGELEWNYQREAAKRAVDDVPGIKAIMNNITIKSEAHDRLEENLVRDALKRHWSICSDDIKIDVVGTKVTLTGVVGSIYEKDEAGRIAWKTPGVMTVDNKLMVDYDYRLIV